jgi:hypothetical protein
VTVVEPLLGLLDAAFKFTELRLAVSERLLDGPARRHAGAAGTNIIEPAGYFAPLPAQVLKAAAGAEFAGALESRRGVGARWRCASR